MIKKYLRLTRIIFQTLVSNPVLFLKKGFLILKSTFSNIKVYPSVKNIDGVIFSLDFEDCSPLKKMIYFDMYEIGIVEVLKTFLRDGDTFIDVGANIGYITAIGASLVGEKGWVHSFEPVPEYFLKLKNLAESNNKYNIIVNQFALSDKVGQEKIYLSDYSNIGANSIFSGLIDKEKIRSSVVIQTRRLDEYIEKNNVKNIRVIKIDTEGFEYPVLLGLQNFFNRNKLNKSFVYPLIVCEVCPPAYSFLGNKLENLFSYMKQFDYLPFSILNPKKELDIDNIKKESTINIIFKNKK